MNNLSAVYFHGSFPSVWDEHAIKECHELVIYRSDYADGQTDTFRTAPDGEAFPVVGWEP